MSGTVEAQLAALVSSRFPFIVDPTVSLMRAYTNAVFRIAEQEDQFALKVYARGWRTDAEIRYEIDLLRHLAGRGVTVATAIPDQHGTTLQHFRIDGEMRQAVLFAFAPGAKAVPPFTPELYEREGAATAVLHAASDDFVSSHARRPLDAATLIEAVREIIRSDGRGQPAARWLDRFGKELGARIALAASGGLDWGPCHGDLTFDNLHLTDDGGFAWYDFDSGGPGWRAMDLQGWVALDPAMQERQDAFVAGYRTVRPLHDRDVAASPVLAAALEFHGIGIDLDYRVRHRGPEAVAACLEKAVHRLDQWRRVLTLGDW